MQKIFDKNLVTGVKNYELARYIRKDENKCGEDAISFEENNFKVITEPYYFVKEYWKISLIFFIGVYYFYELYKLFEKINKQQSIFRLNL